MAEPCGTRPVLRHVGAACLTRRERIEEAKNQLRLALEQLEAYSLLATSHDLAVAHVHRALLLLTGSDASKIVG